MAPRKLPLATIRKVALALPGNRFPHKHYRGYPIVLARLDRLSATDLDELLRRAITGAMR